ncbi:MAG: DUF6730 family protein [Bacteroidota bacterium]
MAKLEEIAELLTEEIEGFNQSIKKLEELTSKINHIKYESDISEIRFQIEEQKRKLELHSNYQNKKLEEIAKIVSKARIFPNWLVVLFFVLVIVLVVIIVYLIFIKTKKLP